MLLYGSQILAVVYVGAIQRRLLLVGDCNEVFDSLGDWIDRTDCLDELLSSKLCISYYIDNTERQCNEQILIAALLCLSIYSSNHAIVRF